MWKKTMTRDMHTKGQEAKHETGNILGAMLGYEAIEEKWKNGLGRKICAYAQGVSIGCL